MPLKPLGSLWDMLKVDAAAFYRALSDLRRFQCMTEFSQGAPADIPLSDKHRNGIRRWAADLDAQFTLLGTGMTQRWLGILVRGLDKPKYSYARFGDEFGKLDTMLKDELSVISIYSLEPNEDALLEPKAPLFGDEVIRAFPDASEDIRLAGKCLALGCDTATIFHLMRAMEEGVKVLGAKLGATVSDANGETLPWGKLVANIKPKIDALPAVGDKDDWYRMHALLHAVNRAFRTKTAHPGSNYSRKEALDAFSAVRSFLQEMAEHV